MFEAVGLLAIPSLSHVGLKTLTSSNCPFIIIVSAFLCQARFLVKLICCIAFGLASSACCLRRSIAIFLVFIKKIVI